MGDGPTILERVRRLIDRLMPSPVCDGCLADRLGDTALEQAQIAARELTAERDFVRESDACSLCGEHAMVTRRQR